MNNYKVAALARSFATISDRPIKILEEAGFELVIRRNHEVYNEEIIADLIGDADACIVGSDKIGEIVFEKCKNLKVISKHGVGLNNIDLELAEKKGIVVTNTPGANRQSTAELAWLLLMAANRNLWNEASGMKSNRGNYKAKALQNDMFGKTLGIIGFGQIGQTVARMSTGFGMKVIAYDPFLKKGEFDYGFGTAFIVELHELLKESDFISINAPATKENYHLINKDTIDLMKNGIVISNAARGELINEDDLYDALVSGKIKAAGLDVFSEEPPVGNKLLELGNVIATPHVGGQSIESNINLGIIAAENVVKNLNITETT
jgi:D-3-phosphoglycerate dehydrogenase